MFAKKFRTIPFKLKVKVLHLLFSCPVKSYRLPPAFLQQKYEVASEWQPPSQIIHILETIIFKCKNIYPTECLHAHNAQKMATKLVSKESMRFDKIHEVY